MEFISGKEQRVLGVIEFIIILFDNFILQCFATKVSANDSMISVSIVSPVATEEADTEQLSENQHGENTVTAVRVFEGIRDTFKFLQLLILVAILVLLHRELQQCSDPTSFIPIYLGFAVIEFNIFFYLTSHNRFKTYFKQEKREEELERTANSVYDTVSLFRRLALSKIKR